MNTACIRMAKINWQNNLVEIVCEVYYFSCAGARKVYGVEPQTTYLTVGIIVYLRHQVVAILESTISLQLVLAN